MYLIHLSWMFCSSRPPGLKPAGLKPRSAFAASPRVGYLARNAAAAPSDAPKPVRRKRCFACCNVREVPSAMSALLASHRALVGARHPARVRGAGLDPQRDDVDQGGVELGAILRHANAEA